MADVAEKERCFPQAEGSPALVESRLRADAVGGDAVVQTNKARHTLRRLLLSTNYDNFIDDDEDCLDYPGRACVPRRKTRDVKN